MKAFAVLALMFSLTACASTPQPTPVNPVVKQMFEDSQLLKCNGLDCVDVATGVRYEGTLLHPKVEGYVVNFPEGKYTPDQVKQHSDEIAGMYIKLLTYLPPQQ